MHFTVGEIVVDVIVDDDDFELPLSQFLPGSHLSLLEQHRNLLEPDFVDLDNDIVKFAIQTFVVRVNGRTILIDTCIGELSFAEPTVANATRRTVLEEASETNRLVVPAHFRGPRCTYVRYTSKKFEPVMTGGIRRASS